MTIQKLKSDIENNRFDDSFLILVCNDKDNNNKKFLSFQYAETIAKEKNVSINFIEELTPKEVNLFDTDDNIVYDNYRYLDTKKFDIINNSILKESRLIICTESVDINKELDSSAKEYIESRVINIPKIEEWQIIDLIMSRAEGITEDNAKWLCSYYNSDLFRINMELDKLNLFLPYEQNNILKEFKEEGIFEDIPTNTIFDITNAISKKDINAISQLYKYRDVLVKPGSEMGFIALIYKTFKNLILVKTASNPTPDNIGLSSGQIWAIKSIPNAFSTTQLITIFNTIADMDRQIKNGEFDVTLINIVDYLLIKILM